MNKIIKKVSKVILAFVLLFTGLMPVHALEGVKEAPDLEIYVNQLARGSVEIVWSHNGAFSEEKYLEYFDYFYNATGWKLENQYGSYAGDIVFDGEHANAYIGESDNELILTIDKSQFDMIADFYEFTFVSAGYEDKVLNEQFWISEQYGAQSSEGLLQSVEQTSPTTITLTGDHDFLTSLYRFDYGQSTWGMTYDLRAEENEQIIYTVNDNSATIEIPWFTNVQTGYYDFELYSVGYQSARMTEIYLEGTGEEDGSDYVPVTMIQSDVEPYDFVITMNEDSDYLMCVYSILLQGEMYSKEITVTIDENAQYDINSDTLEATLSVDSTDFQSLPVGEYDVYIYAEGWDKQLIEGFNLVYGAEPDESLDIQDFVPVTMTQSDVEPYDFMITMNVDSDYLMNLHKIVLQGDIYSNEADVVIDENAKYVFDEETGTITLYVDSSRFQSLAIGEYDVYLYATGYTDQHIEDFKLAHGAKPSDDIKVEVKQSTTKPYDIIISSNDVNYLKDIEFIVFMIEEPFGVLAFPTDIEELYIEFNDKNELVIPYQLLAGAAAGSYTVEFTGKEYAPKAIENGLTLTVAGCVHESLEDLIYLKEQELTCTTDGVKECYYCEKCDAYMLDTENLNWVWFEKDVITNAKGHDYKDGECSVCHKAEPKDVITKVEDLPVVDTTKPVENVTVGTAKETTAVLDETVKELLENIEEGKTVTNVDSSFVEQLQSYVEVGKDVSVVSKVQVENVTGEKVNKDELKLIVEEVSKLSQSAKVAQYLDLSVVLSVVVDDEEKATSKVSKLTKPVVFTIAVPEELKKVEEGYTREYFVLRNHEGEVEKLPVTVNKDGTLSFETDRFSTYALAYVDTKKKTTNTGDMANIALYASLAVATLSGAVVLRKKED